VKREIYLILSFLSVLSVANTHFYFIFLSVLSVANTHFYFIFFIRVIRGY